MAAVEELPTRAHLLAMHSGQLCRAGNQTSLYDFWSPYTPMDLWPQM